MAAMALRFPRRTQIVHEAREFLDIYHNPGLDPWIVSFLRNHEFGMVCDIGAGTGTWGYLLRMVLRSVRILIGLDIDRIKLVRLRETGLYDDLVCCDASFLPFRKSVFDLVLSVGVLHRLPAFDQILRTLDELVGNGRIVIAMPLANRAQLRALVQLQYEVFGVFLWGLFLQRIPRGTVLRMFDSLASRLLSVSIWLTTKLTMFRSVQEVIALKGFRFG